MLVPYATFVDRVGETLQCSECSGWLLPKGVDQPSVVVSVTKRLVIREVGPRGGLASSLSAAEFAGDQIADTARGIHWVRGWWVRSDPPVLCVLKGTAAAGLEGGRYPAGWLQETPAAT